MRFLQGMVKKLKASSFQRELFLAARKGDAVKVSQLLASRTGPDTKGGVWGQTALHQAAADGLIEAASLLLDYGADVNAKDGTGDTPLDAAIWKGNIDMVRLLVERGAEWSLPVAAWLGDVAKVGELLEGGADVNTQGVFGLSALHRAAQIGHVKLVELLLEHGADVNSKTWIGESALNLALEGNHSEVAELLRAHGGQDYSRLSEMES